MLESQLDDRSKRKIADFIRQTNTEIEIIDSLIDYNKSKKEKNFVRLADLLSCSLRLGETRCTTAIENDKTVPGRISFTDPSTNILFFLLVRSFARSLVPYRVVFISQHCSY